MIGRILSDCPLCDSVDSIRIDHDYMWSVHCRDCYDGAPDSGPRARLMGSGHTQVAAIADWNEQADDLRAEEQEEPETCGRPIESDYGDYADGSTHWVTSACREYLCPHGLCDRCDGTCRACPQGEERTKPVFPYDPEDDIAF